MTLFETGTYIFMKQARLLIILHLLIAFFVGVRAQSLNAPTGDATDKVNTALIELGAQSPNELSGFKFFAEGKLNKLKLCFSTAKDVKEIFGTPVQINAINELYDYDSNWWISFQYFDEKRTYLSTFSSELGSIKVVSFPEYSGKLFLIKLFPKKTVSFRQTIFPSDFKAQTGIPTTAILRENSFRSDLYQDAYGLSYEVFNEPGDPEAKGKLVKGRSKGDLLSITYQTPHHLQIKIFDWKNPIRINR
jgi:hypothetical protein